MFLSVEHNIGVKYMCFTVVCSMMFYVFFYTAWLQALSPSSLLSSQEEVYATKENELLYVIDHNKKIYFGGTRQRLKAKVKKGIEGEGILFTESFKVRSITEYTLWTLPRPEGLDRYKWIQFLDKVRTHAWGKVSLGFLSVDDWCILSQFFGSLSKDKYQESSLRNYNRKRTISRIFFMLSEGKAYFSKSASFLKVLLRRKLGKRPLDEKSIKSFHIQSVLLEDLHNISIVPQKYEKEWRNLLKEERYCRWGKGAAEYLRDHILNYISGDKIRSVSHEDLTEYQSKEKNENGLYIYYNPQRKIYYIRRYAKELRDSLEQDYKISHSDESIYCIPEKVISKSRYAYLLDKKNRSSVFRVSRSKKEKLIKDLLEHFKDDYVTYKLDFMQENKDDEEGCRERGEDIIEEDQGCDWMNISGQEEGEGYRDDREGKVERFLFAHLSYDQLCLENFFADFNVVNPGKTQEIVNVYRQYLEEATTYNWIRYLLYLSPYIFKEHILNLSMLFYCQKLMQDIGLEEWSTEIYDPRNPGHKIPVELKKEEKPLSFMFNRESVLSLRSCSKVREKMDLMGSELKCHLEGIDWLTGEKIPISHEGIEALNKESVDPLYPESISEDEDMTEIAKLYLESISGGMTEGSENECLSYLSDIDEMMEWRTFTSSTYPLECLSLFYCA